MAKIRVVETSGDELALVVDDKAIATWNAPHPAAPFMLEISLIQKMLNEAYEKGRADQKIKTSKTLRDIFGLKE